MQVRDGSFDGEKFSDHFDMRSVVLTIRSSIVRSRKRKLRELFAVATEGDAIPNHNFADPNAPPTTPAESQFLIETDILQYVYAVSLAPSAHAGPRLSFPAAALVTDVG